MIFQLQLAIFLIQFVHIWHLQLKRYHCNINLVLLNIAIQFSDNAAAFTSFHSILAVALTNTETVEWATS